MTPSRRPALALFAALLLVGLLAATPSLAAPSARELFGGSAVHQVVVSPSGDHLAFVKARNGRLQVSLRKTGDASETVVATRLVGIHQLVWVDDTHLVVPFGVQPGYLVVGLSGGEGDLVLGEQRIRARGRLVDAMPQMDARCSGRCAPGGAPPCTGCRSRSCWSES